MCLLIIAIQGIWTNSLLSTISLVLNVHVILLGSVRQPFQGDVGLFDSWMITVRRQDGDSVFFKEIRPKHEIAR
jgi:hypothetical protein